MSQPIALTTVIFVVKMLRDPGYQMLQFCALPSSNCHSMVVSAVTFSCQGANINYPDLFSSKTTMKPLVGFLECRSYHSSQFATINSPSKSVKMIGRFQSLPNKCSCANIVFIINSICCNHTKHYTIVLKLHVMH